MLRHLLLSLALITITPLPQGVALNALIVTQRAQSPALGFDPSYKLHYDNPVQDKNFFLLSLFQRHPQVGRLLRRNAVLRSLSNQKTQALRSAANCNEVECWDRLFRFDDLTIERVATELRTLARRPQFRKLVFDHMRPSGVFIKYHELTDAEMLVKAWRDAAHGLNRVLRVYGLGKDPYYKNIDRVSFDVTSDDYRRLLKTKIAEIRFSREPLFFEPTLGFALKLLEANKRDEAGRYEPLEAGQNKATLQALKDINWNDYPYSFILVLGSGPGDTARISKIGARRADQGAQLFLERKAPLIILSGGHVHPMQTPFNEAIEMKKYVMEKFKIPEHSILIDPYARHTTTNFRNAARLAFRSGLPIDRNALVTSSEDHIGVVTKEGFRIRCRSELGYFPMELINRISPITAEWKPSSRSLFFDANDPLDP